MYATRRKDGDSVPGVGVREIISELCYYFAGRGSTANRKNGDQGQQG